MTATASLIGMFLFAIGLIGTLAARSLFKTIVSLTIMESGVLLVLMAAGYVPGGAPPLLPLAGVMAVNPIPQAFAVTAIVIGAANTALGLTFLVAWRQAGGRLDPDGTFDEGEVRHLDHETNPSRETAKPSTEPAAEAARGGDPDPDRDPTGGSPVSVCEQTTPQPAGHGSASAAPESPSAPAGPRPSRPEGEASPERPQ